MVFLRRLNLKEANMPNGEKPAYDVFVSTPGKNGGKAFYHRIGAAWNVASDGISIKLHALPVDGSLVLFPPKEKEE